MGGGREEWRTHVTFFAANVLRVAKAGRKSRQDRGVEVETFRVLLQVPELCFKKVELSKYVVVQA